jgi:excisionase family DNA binding protein
VVKPSPSIVTEPRFITLKDVATYLTVSEPQAYALVRSSDLPAIKIGGRGVWRVERAQLELYIERLTAETAERVKEHPLSKNDQLDVAIRFLDVYCSHPAVEVVLPDRTEFGVGASRVQLAGSGIASKEMAKQALGPRRALVHTCIDGEVISQSSPMWSRSLRLVVLVVVPRQSNRRRNSRVLSSLRDRLGS